MLINALVLAGISTVCYELAYSKLPPHMQRFLVKHALFTDFITFLITYVTLGGTLTALTAGALVSLFTSFLLHVANNQEKFQYLLAIRDWIHEKVDEFVIQANMWARELKARRAQPVMVIEGVSP